MRHFTKGRKYINPVQYDVILEERDEKDVLVFLIDQDGQTNEIVVNLNEATGQRDLMDLFAAILKRLEKERIEFILKVQEGFQKILYKDVCKEYIESLNIEIRDMYDKIQSELHS